MKASLSHIEYGGWPNCLRLADEQLELIITTDVGPRVIRAGRPGGPNFFCEFHGQLGLRGGRDWRIYGGHRFWIAPESRSLTYVPDNSPVEWDWDGRELLLTQRPDRRSGLQKTISIRLERGAVRLIHTLHNRSTRTREVAPWSLTVMTTGGIALLPQEPYGSHTKHLLPCRPLVLWKYTKMNDPRWTWGERLIQLRQDPNARDPQKIGFRSSPAWMAYALPFGTFIKRHGYAPDAVYPDMGSNAEVFTNADILELESLGPLGALKPGGCVAHVETWRIFPRVMKEFNESKLLKVLDPMLSATPRV